MSAEDNRSWRQRNPKGSRVVLYGIGVVVLALLVTLWVRRGAQDESDRIEVLRQRLRALPAVLLSTPGGPKEVVRLMSSDEFADDDLPHDVRALVERTRAMALRHLLSTPEEASEAPAAIEEALTRARALSPPDEVGPLMLEWAEARIDMGNGASVPELLAEDVHAWRAQPVRTLRTYLLAAALAEQGDREAAARTLESFLADLPAPQSNRDGVNVGGRQWTSVQAAVVATERLARWQNTPPIWARLQRLAPDSLDAHVRAAGALAAMGAKRQALVAWTRALALDGAAARRRLNNDRTLRPLAACVASAAK